MTSAEQLYDVIILGGGAAGLMCALTAGKRGKQVLVLEVSNKFGKKILMSGGGRCNFTNLDVQPEHFICNNPHFVKSALSQYSQWDFINLVERHGIAYHEKSQGQLFCDHSAKDILNLLLSECRAVGVHLQKSCTVEDVGKDSDYTIKTSQGQFTGRNLVVATGGLSIPTLGGATGMGYRVAEQFGLQVNQTEASLVPFTLTGKWHDHAAALAGVSVPVAVSVPAHGFTDSLLFTHRGLSGPAILQLSNYWYSGDLISIDLVPGLNASERLLRAKSDSPNKSIVSSLSEYLPKSLLHVLQSEWWPGSADQALQGYKNEELVQLGDRINNWQLTPSGTEGYRTAEVTRGGVDVDDISSKSMQVKGHDGLYFIGEVLDVTGHLGGYNFQWAWSSGYVAGLNV